MQGGSLAAFLQLKSASAEMQLHSGGVQSIPPARKAVRSAKAGRGAGPDSIRVGNIGGMIIFGMLPRVIWIILPGGRQAPGISPASTGSPETGSRRRARRCAPAAPEGCLSTGSRRTIVIASSFRPSIRAVAAIGAGAACAQPEADFESRQRCRGFLRFFLLGKCLHCNTPFGVTQ